MKQTIKTGLTALVLLLAMSCKKENSNIQASGIASASATQNLLMDDKVLAGNTVRIGSQVWMTKNLAVTRYRNGDKIPEVRGGANWASLTTGAWCWYKNDSAAGAIYGKLYNWYAINDPRGLAPEGWHIPTSAEWDILGNFLGPLYAAGSKMKEVGTTHWLAPNNDATNSSGFTALPGGIRYYNGLFNLIRNNGFWWSSTASNPGFASFRILGYNATALLTNEDDDRSGFSVRCIKD